MIEKIYFYRKFGTADFILSEKEKKIIPVRIKNQFLPDNLGYNWSNNIWEKADSIPEENDETPEGKLIRNITISIAEFEINSYSKRRKKLSK